MRRQVPIGTQVYNKLFPYPLKDKDPPTWQDHVRKNLVHEVRVEVQSFYGLTPSTSSPESRFPGLSYTYPPHIHRLRKYPHHRHLFRALDSLRLTPSEIYYLCDWEGTLVVRRRYEAQNGVRLRDTTGDEIVERMVREAERERVRREREGRERSRRERWLGEGVVGHAGGEGARAEQRSLEVEACRDAEIGRGAGVNVVDETRGGFARLPTYEEGVGAEEEGEGEIEEEGEMESDEEGSVQEEPMSEIQLRRLARSINFPGAVQSIRQEAVSQMRRSGTISRGSTPAVAA